MSLSFSSPALLLALAGAALPLLVHLLRQQQPLRTPFPALVLLLGAQRRHARRRRLRDLLLLLVRMALLAAVALTLAGPNCSFEVPVPATAGQDQAAVILVDDSLSMRYRRRGRTLFNVARERVLGLLDVLPPTAQVAILTTTDTGRQIPELSLNRGRLLGVAAALLPTWRSASASDGLVRAQALLRDAPAGKPRVIYLVTDLTRVSLPEKPRLGPKVRLEVIDVAGGALPNLGLLSLDGGSPSVGSWGAHGKLLFQVRVRNSTGHQRRGVRVTLAARGKELTRGSVDLAPHGESTLSLEVPEGAIPPGARFLEAILPGDALGADDTRALALGRQPPLRVLLVDGDPRETRYDDEVFHLEAALRSFVGEGLRFYLRVVAGADLPTASLDKLDVVILANVGSVERSAVTRLERFVRRGGGLLVTLGDQVDPEGYNQTLGKELLPGWLRSIRAGGVSGGAGGSGRISMVGTDPFLAGSLADPAARRSLASGRVWRHGLVGAQGHRVLMRLFGGAPLLLERRIGLGRVLLWTTSIDRGWTDLPLRPAFLPLVRGMLLLAGGRGEPASRRRMEVGQPVQIRLGSGDRGLVVRDPLGHLHKLTAPGARARPGQAVRFDRTDVPGGYRVYSVSSAGDLAERPGAAFVVTPPAAESDLRRLPGPPHAGSSARGGRLRQATLRRDLSGQFALLCLLLLLAEALLAARFGSWRLSPWAPGSRGTSSRGAPPGRAARAR